MAAMDPNTPAMMPPPGVTPNFDAESRAGSVIVTSITVTALMVVLVVLRLYSRMWYLKSLSYEDYSCIAAALGSIGLTIAVILSTTAGFGRHLWNYPIKIFTESYFQKVLAVQGLYSPVILLVKLSLFLLYLRIFSRIRRTKFLIYFGIGFNMVFYVTSFALILYFCGPSPGSGSIIKAMSRHRCIVDARNLGTVQASFNIFSDIYLLCVPIPVVSKLQLSGKRKIGVYAMFMTGSLAVICSILNLYYRIMDNRTLDYAWAIPPVYITSVVEVNVGIMCGCFPALPPVIRSIRLFLSTNKGSSGTRLNSPRYFKWAPFKNSGDTLRDSKARVTLGPRINGNGHFFTLKSMSAGEDEMKGSVDVSLQGHEPSMQTNIRSSYSQDPELGPQRGGIRVETQLTSA